LLRASALGAGLAAASCIVLRVCDSMHALQLAALVCLLLAGIHQLSARRTGATRVPGGWDIHLPGFVAACAAGCALWLLAPWTSTSSKADHVWEIPQGRAERAWLCHNSLLATPYSLLHARVLIAAEPEHARLLRICAEERSRGRAVESVALNPTARGGVRLGARALVRRAAKRPYDVILTSPSAPVHFAPMGVLPYAQAPLETVEGVRDLLSALSPTGAIATTLLGEPATLRWIRTVRAALPKLEGVTPERMLVVYEAGGAYTVLARRTPFETDSLIALNIAQHRPPAPAPATLRRAPVWLRTRPELQFTPGPGFDNRVADEARATHAAQDAAHYAFELRPASDDWPLFFESTRLSRPDTWSSGTWYRVLGRSLPLSCVLALLFAAWATRGRAVERSERARLIAAYGMLALSQALAYGFAQHVAALWLPRATDAPALCAFVLLGTAAVCYGIPDREQDGRMVHVQRLLVLLAMFALLVFDSAPGPEIAMRWGDRGMAWAAVGMLALIGVSLGWPLRAIVRQTPSSLRTTATTIYLAALAPAVLLGPVLVLLFGYRSTPWCAAGMLLISALVAPRARRA
jgi:hypothetical protein